MSIEASPGFTNAFVECFPSFRKDHKGIPKRRYFEKRMREELGKTIESVGTLYKVDPRISYTREQINSYERELILKFEDNVRSVPWITHADIGEERKIREGMNANLKHGLFSIISGLLNLVGQGVVGKIKFAKVTLLHTGTPKVAVKTLSRGGYREVLEDGITYVMFLPGKLRVTVEKVGGTAITTTGLALSVSHAYVDKLINFYMSDPEIVTLKLFEPIGSGIKYYLSFARDFLTDVIPGPFGAISTILKMLAQTAFSIYAWRCDLEKERMEDHNWRQIELNNLRLSREIGEDLFHGCHALAWNSGNNFVPFENLTKALGLTHLMWSRV